ncbi:unnamed protein product [Onchocerca flexuosa]|uniref:C2H2-type domain-containing protein n=1 Tax=Onchocerca flexuosa TaxID=387005 RepID=A0A183I492_9BILA|nr:unnamed protein product [Onchocerca flexuosa]
MYWCDLCKVQLSSEALLDMHNSGKRHLKKVTERDTLLALAARSVFISGLNPEITITESEVLLNYFLLILFLWYARNMHEKIK